MLSVVIITKNEELSLGACLESIRWADEIIILDSGSTDNTLAIAKKFTSKVHTTRAADWKGYGVQKQRALDLASGDWVLNLDADEMVTEELRQAILLAINSDNADAYRIPIRMCFYGRVLRYSSSPKRHIRLFKRTGARYSNDVVHEKVILPPQARIARLSIAILHHSFRDVSHALYKMNRYSSYSANIRIQEQKPITFLKLLLGSVWMFNRCYFIQRGFLDGKVGFLLAVMQAQGTFYRGVKQIFPDGKGQAHLEVKHDF
jgi:glycosyltransferase involved in cell wall biosynthesis